MSSTVSLFKCVDHHNSVPQMRASMDFTKASVPGVRKTVCTPLGTTDVNSCEFSFITSAGAVASLKNFSSAAWTSDRFSPGPCVVDSSRLSTTSIPLVSSPVLGGHSGRGRRRRCRIDSNWTGQGGICSPLDLKQPRMRFPSFCVPGIEQGSFAQRRVGDRIPDRADVVQLHRVLAERDHDLPSTLEERTGEMHQGGSSPLVGTGPMCL